MGTTTVNISFQSGLLERIDEAADRESRSRSELLREAARMYLERKQRWEKIFAYGKSLSARRKLSDRDVDNEIALNRARKRRKR
jgi:CopG family transcriptional regulator / antitoxin EndoAI